MAKLTLRAEREVIEKAKRLAAERNIGVSAMCSRVPQWAVQDLNLRHPACKAGALAN